MWNCKIKIITYHPFCRISSVSKYKFISLVIKWWGKYNLIIINWYSLTYQIRTIITIVRSICWVYAYPYIHIFLHEFCTSNFNLFFALFMLFLFCFCFIFLNFISFFVLFWVFWRFWGILFWGKGVSLVFYEKYLQHGRLNLLSTAITTAAITAPINKKISKTQRRILLDDPSLRVLDPPLIA